MNVQDTWVFLQHPIPESQLNQDLYIRQESNESLPSPLLITQSQLLESVPN